MLSICLLSLTASMCILLISWSDNADVLKLSLKCLSEVSHLFSVFLGVSCSQNIFSSSENCSQFHFLFPILIVLGFGRDLELKVMCVLFFNVFLPKNLKKKVELFFSIRINCAVVELKKKTVHE